jgi:uncharacterized protein
MPAARLSLRAGAGSTGRRRAVLEGAGWGGGWSGGGRSADADLGGSCPCGQAGAGGREARASLGFPVAVPAAVYLDAAAGQAGQRVIAVRLGQRGGQAGGGRTGAGGGDDGAAGRGERDLAGVHWLAGAWSLAGGDGDRRGGAGGGAGQLGGGHPGGVLLRDQGGGRRAQHRAGWTARRR